MEHKALESNTVEQHHHQSKVFVPDLLTSTIVEGKTRVFHVVEEHGVFPGSVIIGIKIQSPRVRYMRSGGIRTAFDSER